jgi:fatty-acyl-CoA synthase
LRDDAAAAARRGGADADALPGPPPSSSDIASYLHTGGTTGTPKLAARTHSNEVSNAWMIACNDLLDQDSVTFAALPLFHPNALLVTVLAPLLKGQHVVWGGPLGYRDTSLFGNFWKIVGRHRIAAMSAVPTVYSVLAQVPVDADISSLKLPIVGAAPLSPAVASAFETRTGAVRGLWAHGGQMRERARLADRATLRHGRAAPALPGGSHGPRRRDHGRVDVPA